MAGAYTSESAGPRRLGCSDTPRRAGRAARWASGKVDRTDTEAACQSVTKARSDTDAARKLLAACQDPIDARAAVKAEQREAKEAVRLSASAGSLTLARAARAYHEKFVEPHLGTRHSATWISSLEIHVPEKIWHKPIASVEASELLDVLLDVYAAIPETASRVRQRLEVVFDDALLRGAVTTNPAAAIRRNLTKIVLDKQNLKASAPGSHSSPTS